MQSAFRALAEKVPASGVIVTNAAHPHIAPILNGLRARVIDYDRTAEEPAYQLFFFGEFNQANARAAAAAARVLIPSFSTNDIRDSLSRFHGIWRRFDYKGETENGAEVYDDYAHHPTAIRETLRVLRGKTEGKIFVAFHPHLYSRTRDLLDDFAHAFADADEVLVAPIYAAREIDDSSISSEILAAAIVATGTRAHAATFEEIQRVLSAEPSAGDIIMTMGAGDIYKVADNLIRV